MLFLKGNNRGLASSRMDLRACVELSPLFNVSREDLQGSCIVQIMKERSARKVCYTILGVPMFENREGHEWSWDDLDQHLKLGCIETYCSLVLVFLVSRQRKAGQPLLGSLTEKDFVDIWQRNSCLFFGNCNLYAYDYHIYLLSCVKISGLSWSSCIYHKAIDDDQKKLTFSRMPARFSRDSFSLISLDFFSKFSLMLLPEEIF
ncbi:hypothetical protein VNO77_44046 [Canavalia gladiata]|uniref:Uncharacterized protein n=1 Tax=Canavalia gladiata TaxID=3824 RepID=A0AAN9PNF7_CANGL